MSILRPMMRPIMRPMIRPVFRGSAFDPLSLFANGEQGAWYDPSDLTTLYQDSAGTTTVTADGDPVGLMLDKSGNGNHASQANSSARPTYPGLVYDGVDDYLKSVFSSHIDVNSNGIFVVVALSITSDIYPFALGNPEDANTFLGIRSQDGTLELVDRTSESLFRASVIKPSTSEMAVYTFGVDPDLAEVFCRVNGEELVRVGAQSGAMSLRQCAYGALPRAADDFFGGGTFSSSVVRFGKPTTQDIQATEQFLAQKAGVTL